MNRLFFLFAFVFLYSLQSFGQSSGISVSVSADTIVLGDYIELRYTLENLQTQLNVRDFPGFEIIGGPNTSSRMSIINGEVSRSATYTYFLRPISPGMHRIEAIEFESEGQRFFSSPMQIIVLEKGETKDPFKGKQRKTTRL